VSAYTAYTETRVTQILTLHSSFVYVNCVQKISVYLILFSQEIIYNHLTAARKYQTTLYFSENFKGRSSFTVLFLKIKLQLLFYILMKSK
jgi:hypothetical protein